MRTYDELSLAEKVTSFCKTNATRYLPATHKTTTPRLISIGIFWGAPRAIGAAQHVGQLANLAGRGFGKSARTPEWVRANMCGDTPMTGGRWRHVALIAETAADQLRGPQRPQHDAPWCDELSAGPLVKPTSRVPAVR